MTVKKYFRYLRGELNGFYLNKLAYFLNSWVEKNILPEMYYMKVFQFDFDYMDKLGYGKEFSKDLFNIAKTAGLTQILAQGNLLTNALLMTNSEQSASGKPCFAASGSEMSISFSKEVSESGLYDTEKEAFDFRYRNTKPDIVDNATEKLQSALVPDDYPIVGYVPMGTAIYDREGKFIPEAILSSPPTDGTPYSNYYGEKFMHLSEEYLVFRTVPEIILYKILLIVQYVRYNGSSTKSFAELTSVIVGPESSLEGEPDQGFIELKSHIYDPDKPYQVTWTYVNDIKKTVNNRVIRLNIWQALAESFFPQIVLTEDLSTVDTN